ncbi:MAG: GAF domain-containing protein, partial [Spirochaetales bacterium]|nr:GAF domain-containing protein [Spirochaetales bacterium]
MRLIKDYLAVDALRIFLKGKGSNNIYNSIGYPQHSEKQGCNFHTLTFGLDPDCDSCCLCQQIIAGINTKDLLCTTERGSVWINDLQAFMVGQNATDQYSCLLHYDHAFHSAAYIPIRDGNQVIGLLQLSRRKRGFFNRNLMNVLENIAFSLSEAIAKISIKEELLIQNKRYRDIAALYETKNKDLEELVYIASHDLRSPLVNIMGFTKEVSKQIGTIRQQISEIEKHGELTGKINKIIDEDIAEAMEFIYPNITKMDKLIATLTRMSRISNSVMDTKVVNMKNVINELMHIFSLRLEAKKINVRIGTLPDCYGDEALLVQAFSNLIDNAIKYTDS